MKILLSILFLVILLPSCSNDDSISPTDNESNTTRSIIEKNDSTTNGGIDAKVNDFTDIEQDINI